MSIETEQRFLALRTLDEYRNFSQITLRFSGIRKSVFHGVEDGHPVAIKLFHDPVTAKSDATHEFDAYTMLFNSPLKLYVPEPGRVLHRQKTVAAFSVLWKEGGSFADMKKTYYPPRVQLDFLRSQLLGLRQPPFPSQTMWDPANIAHDKIKGVWFTTCALDYEISLQFFRNKMLNALNHLITDYCA